jgi:hypothetical protein
LLGLDVEQPARRTTDAIGMHGCFRAIDCISTAGSRGRNRPTTSRRAKIWVASGRMCAHPTWTVVPHHGDNARCATARRRRARPCLRAFRSGPCENQLARLSCVLRAHFLPLLIVGPRLQLRSRGHRQVGRDQSFRRDLAKRATASNSAALGHSGFTEQVPDCRMTWDGQAPLACRWTNPDTAHLDRSDTLQTRASSADRRPRPTFTRAAPRDVLAREVGTSTRPGAAGGDHAAMTIVRREHRAQFTIVPNSIFLDDRLSDRGQRRAWLSAVAPA